MSQSTSSGPWTKPANVILTSIVLSCGLSIGLIALLHRLPMPWTIRYLQADTVAIGGGAGQSSITLSTQRQLDGAAMVILKGATSEQSLSLTANSYGRPSITLDGPSGKASVVVEVDASGAPVIRLMNSSSGAVAWRVTVGADGKPVVQPE